MIRAKKFNSLDKEISTYLHIEDNGSDDYTYIKNTSTQVGGHPKRYKITQINYELTTL